MYLFWPYYFETYHEFQPREVASLADISLNAWSPSNDPTRIPEVRHNVRLIANACKSDLDGLAREAKTLQERNKFVTVEEARLRKKVDDETNVNCFRCQICQITHSFFVVIARLQQVQLLVNDINVIARNLPLFMKCHWNPFRLISESLSLNTHTNMTSIA